MYNSCMTLRQLITQSNYKKVFNYIRVAYYKGASRDEIIEADIGFRAAWDKLSSLSKNSDRANFLIFISEIYDDLASEYFIDVSLRDPVSDSIFSMDFSCWSEIIDLNIEDVVGLQNNELLSHILWQISFWGFSEGKSIKKKEQLAELWKKFKKEFKKDFDDIS